MRMQHHVVGRAGDLVKVPGGVSTVDQPQLPQSLNFAGFETHIALSFYFHSYRWAYFWKGILKTSPDENADLCYTASLAVTVGYLAKSKGNADLEYKAARYSSTTINAVQSILNRGSKTNYASILPVITTLGIYNASIHNQSPLPFIAISLL